MKYTMSYTQKDGTKVINQIFTAENITRKLIELESYGATNIEIKSVDDDKK